MPSSRDLDHEADHAGRRGTSVHHDDIPDLAEPVADGIEDGAPGEARGENPLCAHLSSVVGGSDRRRVGSRLGPSGGARGRIAG